MITKLIIVMTAAFMKVSAIKMFVKQTFNKQSLFSVLKVLGKPQLCIPDYYLANISDLKIDRLKLEGVKGIIFDKDNTLTHTYSNEFDFRVQNVVNSCNSEFPQAVAILSNSIGSCDDDEYYEAKITEEKLGIPVIRHRKKKPGCIDEVLQHFQDHLGHNVQPHELCMIGDRVLTDIVFGNLHGMKTILVKPISQFRDHPIAVIIRLLETKVLLPILKLFLSPKITIAQTRR